MPLSTLDAGSIRYTIDGQGPSLLLLHSLGTSRSLWAGVAEMLVDSFTVIVPDLLGHGDSSPPVTEIGIPGHADVIAAFLSDIGHARAAVAGTSLGGLIALDLAARYPSRVSHLVLNGCPGWHLESQRMARLHTITSRMVGADGLVRSDVEGGGTIRPVSDDARRQRRDDLSKAGRWFLSSLWAVAAFDPISRLSAVTAPTLVLMGDGDFHLSTSYALSTGIAHAEHRLLPNAGHLTPLDDPSGVARELRSFFGRTGG